MVATLASDMPQSSARGRQYMLSFAPRVLCRVAACSGNESGAALEQLTRGKGCSQNPPQNVPGRCAGIRDPAFRRLTFTGSAAKYTVFTQPQQSLCLVRRPLSWRFPCRRRNADTAIVPLCFLPFCLCLSCIRPFSFFPKAMTFPMPCKRGFFSTCQMPCMPWPARGGSGAAGTRTIS